ncbi:MAG TPA: hypothetical protein VFK05_03150 [Polyangiaceae bacterium]|nr:hypothetical protein [Polyangiaceae bacterium]
MSWASVAVFSLSLAALQGCSGRAIPSGEWTAGSAGSNSSGQSGLSDAGAGHALGGRAAGGTASTSELAGRAGEPSTAGDGGGLAEGGAAGDADQNRGGAGVGGAAGGADPSGGGLAGIADQNGGTAGAIGGAGGAAIGGAGGGAIGGAGGGAIGGADTGGHGGSAGSAGSAGANPWCSLGRYCRNDNLYICDANGAEVLFYPCSLDGEYCDDLDNKCTRQVCKPNQPACNGSFATTCNAHGSGTLPGGTDCSATQQTCGQSGACATKVCEPNHSFFSGNTVYQCDEWGTASGAVLTCGSGKHCFTLGDRADCATDACSPGKSGCAGESFGQCGADGNSVTNATLCSASSQVCTEQGCASSSVNTIDPTPRSADWGSSGIYGNAFDVSNARTLTAIESYLRLDFAYNLHWQIYELDGLTGEPNPAPKWILRYQVTTNDSGAGFHSSGPLSFPLLAGHTYLFGVEVLAFGPNTNIWYTYEHGPNVPQTLPFARTAGNVGVSAASKVGDAVSASNFGYQLLYQRLTTSAP